VNRKRWLLVVLIAFPSVFWLLLETSTINTKRMPVYGPRTVSASGDSVYHAVTDNFYSNDSLRHLDAGKFPLFVVFFASKSYSNEGYRMGGLTEYMRYKPDKISEIPFVFLTQRTNAPAFEAMRSAAGELNLSVLTWPEAGYDSLQRTFFSQKPYYIDYSFLVLVDKERHVRGYYDARYAAEVKRLAAEYRHLRLKEEKRKMIRENEIETRN
jgi:hypothetical protein